MQEKLIPEEKPFGFPKDNGVIFLKKEENVIAICTYEGCGKVIFVGNTDSPIGLRVLRQRVQDHIGFFDPEEYQEHEIDLIYPREGKNGRITDSSTLDLLGISIYAV